jgi:hypothetical protein
MPALLRRATQLSSRHDAWPAVALLLMVAFGLPGAAQGAPTAIAAPRPTVHAADTMYPLRSREAVLQFKPHYGSNNAAIPNSTLPAVLAAKAGHVTDARDPSTVVPRVTPHALPAAPAGSLELPQGRALREEACSDWITWRPTDDHVNLCSIITGDLTVRASESRRTLSPAHPLCVPEV